MMPKFSRQSKQRLATAHPDLQRLFNEVIKTFDCTIICGTRSEYDQNILYEAKRSKLKWPKSKHNKQPSMAVDAAPYIAREFRAVWEEKQIYYFAGYVKATAQRMGINIRCGGDWDNDNDTGDQTFLDPGHFELIEGDNP